MLTICSAFGILVFDYCLEFVFWCLGFVFWWFIIVWDLCFGVWSFGI